MYCSLGERLHSRQVRYWSLTSLNITQMISDRYISGLDIRAGIYVMPMTPTVGLPNHRQLKGRHVTSGFAESADTEAPELCASVNAYYIPRLQVRYVD